MPDEKPKTKPTFYWIFQRAESHTWILVGSAQTHGAEAAIHSVAKTFGIYAAVPGSNWTERKVEAEAPPPPKLSLVPSDTLSQTEPGEIAESFPEPQSLRVELRAEDEISKLAAATVPAPEGSAA